MFYFPPFSIDTIIIFPLLKTVNENYSIILYLK